MKRHPPLATAAVFAGVIAAWWAWSTWSASRHPEPTPVAMPFTVTVPASPRGTDVRVVPPLFGRGPRGVWAWFDGPRNLLVFVVSGSEQAIRLNGLKSFDGDLEIKAGPDESDRYVKFERADLLRDRAIMVLPDAATQEFPLAPGAARVLQTEMTGKDGDEMVRVLLKHVANQPNAQAAAAAALRR
jgi:hypothetical protein